MNQVKGSESAENDFLNFPVVGIGASAGGLEAFKKLLKAITPDSGMAYIFIQHMSPEHESMLPDILAKISPLPVHPLENEIQLLPNNIYVMPSGSLLTVVNGRLKLQDRDSQNKNIKIIDLFFSSLGIVHQSFAAGVVLSGTASDGTLGLKVIKANGGITIAQDQSSTFDGMPQSAIRSGDVDFILSPEKIPAKLVEINKPFHTIDIKQGETGIPNDEENLRQILSIIRIRKNTDFSNYKKTTIKRRIMRRMALNKILETNDYLEFLKKTWPEQDLLYKDLLISVSYFFRESVSFDTLRHKVFPELITAKKPNETLRIWVVGCATGEEAYSMAICLQEFVQGTPYNLKLQIFATDISESAIVKARNGIYDKSEMEGLSDSQKDQFFTKRDGHFQIIKQIREMCVFAHHNFLQDPPFAKMDLISCRNVLIYLEPVLQKKALHTFHYALNQKGYLLLGRSESLGSVASSNLFHQLAKDVKLFEKKGISGSLMPVTSRRIEQGMEITDKKKEIKIQVPDFQKAADELVLTNFSPPGVIINENYDIIQFRGGTSKWLEPHPGKATFNLLKMAKEGLSFEIRNVLYKLKTGNIPVKKENINFITESGKETVTIEAIALPSTEPHYLVLFHNTQSDNKNKSFAQKTNGPEINQEHQSTLELHITQLEKELSVTREDMRNITEAQEAANEELQSTNEELLSSGEELQTLNEELQTSNEEVQSTNEELKTINQELLDRNDQLNIANKYSEAIVDTIRDPFLILDKELRIRSASKGFYEKFKTVEADVEGNLFFELKICPWNDAHLIKKIMEVVTKKISFKDYELTCNFPQLGRRILLVNAGQIEKTTDIQLIFISLEDITIERLEKIELQDSKRKLEERIKLAIEATGIGTWDFDPRTQTIIFDDECKRLFGFEESETLTYTGFQSVIHADDRILRNQALERALKGDMEGSYKISFRIRTKNTNQERWISSKGKVFFDENKVAVRLVGTMLDITNEKLSEQMIKESEERFRLASDASTAMIWMSGTDGLCTYFNKSWLEFTGKDLQEEYGNGWTKNIYAEDLKGFTENYNRSFEKREKFYLECRMRYHDGTYRWVSYSGAPRYSYGDLFQGYVGICMDIQNQRMSKEQLEEMVRARTTALLIANNQLESSNHNLSEFAYVASHDLQEPLRKIKTFSQLLREESKDISLEDLSNYLYKIDDSATRMGHLIEDLLNYSRLQNTEEAFVLTNLNEVVDLAIKEFDLEISQKKAIIDIRGLPALKVVPLRIHQLFHNLFSNSLKFIRPGTQPVIVISSKLLNSRERAEYPSLDQELRYVQISFSDNGIGFKQEFAEKAFTIFQRLNGRSEYEGTGIGLAICRKIVINHGGIMFAHSRENEGTEFIIILPVS